MQHRKTWDPVNTHNELVAVSSPTRRILSCAHLRASAHAQSEPVRLRRAFTLLPEVTTQLVVIDSTELSRQPDQKFVDVSSAFMLQRFVLRRRLQFFIISH